MKARSEKCPSCGKQHVPGFAFCQRCGAPLSQDVDDEAGNAWSVAAAAETNEVDGEFEEIAPVGTKKAVPSGRAGCAGGLIVVLIVLAALLFRWR